MAGACSRQQPVQEFVARVGNTYLTREELSAMMAEGDSLDRSRVYVNNWITGELLYQEAMRRGLVETEEVRRKVDAVKRRMAVNALLDQELFADSATVTDVAVRTYYESHQDDFRLKEDVALVSFRLFDDRDAANAFRSRILRGSEWHEAVQAAQTDPALASHVKGYANRRFATRTTLYPEELWKVVRTMRKEGISFVISTDDGYYVIFLHELRQQGEPADLSYVSDEIRGRLAIDARRYQYSALLQEARSRFPIEVRFQGVTADSGAAFE